MIEKAGEAVWRAWEIGPKKYFVWLSEKFLNFILFRYLKQSSLLFIVSYPNSYIIVKFLHIVVIWVCYSLCRSMKKCMACLGQIYWVALFKSVMNVSKSYGK